MTNKTNAIAAILSIMNKIEGKMFTLKEGYTHLCKEVETPFNPSEEFLGELLYGTPKGVLEPLGEYQWLLKEGLLGALAQINGQETFKTCKTGDYLLGVLNALYRADKNWADDPDYETLEAYRDSL